jgi:hypothetical protein
MKNLFFIIIIIFMADNLKSQTPQTIEDFGFLLGKWQMQTKKGVVYEEWQLSGDRNKLTGSSYRVKDNDTTLLENLELSIEKDGIFYIPTVIDQNEGLPIKFKLISWKNQVYIFENPEHDFPQRIVYFPKDKNNLHARIEGKYNGSEASSEFIYTRVEQ